MAISWRTSFSDFCIESGRHARLRIPLVAAHSTVLLAWAPEEKLFPISLAHRLQERLPNSTLRTIDDSYTFVPEDQPEELVKLILEFVDVSS